jgi:hypothetical protein
MLAGRGLVALLLNNLWSLRGNSGTLEAAYGYSPENRFGKGDFLGRRF